MILMVSFQDALQAQMVIKKMSEMIETKEKTKDCMDEVENNIVLNNNNEPNFNDIDGVINPLLHQDHQNNIHEVSVTIVYPLDITFTLPTCLFSTLIVWLVSSFFFN